MDKIIQLGDLCNAHYSIWSDLTSIISALIGAIISGLIALFIFILGLKKEKQKKRLQYISESNDFEDYFFHNLSSLIFFTNKQVEEISKCSQRLKNWTLEDFTLSIFPEINTEDILSMDQEKIYKIFVQNREGLLEHKANDFINVRNCFYNIDNFIKTQNELNKKINQRIVVNIELWNNSLTSLLKLSNKFVVEYNLKPDKGKDEFLELFSGLIVKKQREIILENKSENMQIVLTEIIDPLKAFLKNNKQSNDSRLIMIAEPIMNIQKSYHEINHLSIEKRKSILFAGRRLLHIKDNLKRCINSTQNRTKKYN